MDNKELLANAYENLKEEAESVSNALSCINEESFLNAIKAIAAAPCVITTACGISGMAAMKFAHSLCCLERPARFLSPSEALHGGLGFVQKGDIVVLISKGGFTSELNPILDISKKRGAVIITVTENPNSYLALNSDILLQAYTKKEIGKNNILYTSSFLVTVAILDALTCALMDLLDFDISSFSEIHPGGAVGKKLANINDKEK